MNLPPTKRHFEPLCKKIYYVWFLYFVSGHPVCISLVVHIKIVKLCLYLGHFTLELVWLVKTRNFLHLQIQTLSGMYTDTYICCATRVTYWTFPCRQHISTSVVQIGRILYWAISHSILWKRLIIFMFYFSFLWFKSFDFSGNLLLWQDWYLNKW